VYLRDKILRELGFFPILPAMEQTQLLQYIAVLILLVLAVGATGGMIAMSLLLGKKGGTSKIKDTAYECGMLPIGDGAPRMSVKFYLVAMLFILFDIEVVFMYPWAVIYKSMLADPLTRNMILGAMLSFLGILVVGYLYALKKKAFDWKS
jgi:NADH-quinone oxidoreductase subunit A